MRELIFFSSFVPSLYLFYIQEGYVWIHNCAMTTYFVNSYITEY